MKDFKKMTVKALKAECKSQGIKRYSKLKKAQLITLLQQNQKVETPKAPTPKAPTPVPVIDTTEAPLPPNLSNSPMTPVASPIEESKEDVVLSDLDEFIGNYDENIKKAQEQKEAEEQKMKQEMLEKLEKIKKQEEEKIIENLSNNLTNDIIEKSKNELKTEKPKPKKVKKQLKRPVRKIKKQPKQLDLSSISIEDLIAEATKRGYRMTKIQKLNKKQIKLLKNTVIL